LQWLADSELDDPDLAVAFHASLAGSQALTQTVPSQVTSKGNFADLVCEADVAADKAVHAELTRRVPGDAVVSEELAPDSQATSRRLWIVDPLDGTTAFLLGERRVVSTMIALIREHRLEVSVITFPFSGDWWYAVKGKGAWHNGQRVACSPPSSVREAWVDLNQYGDIRFETSAFASLDRQLRSCCRLVTRLVPHSGIVCSVIDGQIAAVIHDNHHKKLKQAVWDLAPQVLLVEEAGGVALDSRGVSVRQVLEQRNWKSGRIVGLQGFVIIAASRHLSQQLLELRLDRPRPNRSLVLCVLVGLFGLAAALRR